MEEEETKEKLTLLEKEMDILDDELSSKTSHLEDIFEKLIENQNLQLQILNKNLEMVVVLLGEISESLFEQQSKKKIKSD